MRHHRSKNILSNVGLALFAVVAAGLSAAALLHNGPETTTMVASHSATIITPSTSSSALNIPSTYSPQPTPESTSGDDESSTDVAVVVIGDEHSESDTPGVWVDSVAEDLEWTSVTNLSSPGRGYLRNPVSCDIATCANFMGTVGLIAEKNPDLVITFGGTADDDNDLSAAATKYYTALREALPDAEIVAISPVTTQNEDAYWLKLHNATIRAGVESVGGTFIDVGQPGIGDGDELSTDAQDKVADAIVEALS